MLSHTLPAFQLPGVRAVTPEVRLVSGPAVAYAGLQDAQLFEDTSSLADLGHRPQSHRVCLAPQLESLKQMPLFDEAHMPDDVVKQHYVTSVPPSVWVYGLTGYELGGLGFLRSGGKIFFQPDILPRYFLNQLQEVLRVQDDRWMGALFKGDVVIKDVDGPVATVLHPNLIYGHFLLEILPKLCVLLRLRMSGVAFTLALPRQIPRWVREIVGLYYGQDEIIEYDLMSERVRAPCFIVPSMMHTDYQFHPELGVAVETIKRHLLPKDANSRSRRIWISRVNAASDRTILRNEAEVEDVLRHAGFEIVHPQELSFPEQVALFDSAEWVVGEFGSGIHNTIFSRPGARVMCINRINWYQSGIARLRSQPLAYFPPADGFFRDWRHQKTPEAAYTVDCTSLADSMARFFAE